jgi:hypothetical protein
MDEVAARMGGFLRGFDDSRIHLGSARRFADQFRRVMNHPALRTAGEGQPVSYSEAVRFYRLSGPEAQDGQNATPVSTMMRGLREAASLATELRGELDAARVREGVTSLLRLPALMFYLQVSDYDRFFAKASAAAEKNGFLLARSSAGLKMVCPSCGGALPQNATRGAGKCTFCGKEIEVIRPLVMVQGAAATVSYDMLRLLTEMTLVETYQEESEIEPFL